VPSVKLLVSQLRVKKFVILLIEQQTIVQSLNLWLKLRP